MPQQGGYGAPQGAYPGAPQGYPPNQPGGGYQQPQQPGTSTFDERHAYNSITHISPF